MAYILGLDLGTNSIGWACIDPGAKKVLGAGTRIFQEGVNRDTKGKEVSKNETRRMERQSRRQHSRKSQRRDYLKDCLRQNGMFPAKPEEEAAFFKLDPYALRKRGLDEKLTKLEFGRAIYHLNQRRGFKSGRKSEKGKDDGKVKEAITLLQNKINEANCRTLGEYLAGLDPMEDRVRNRYTLRKMCEDEFDLLWRTQQKFCAELTDALGKELRDRVIFFQRPLKSVAHLIGPCSLEPDKKRCKKGAFEAQRFRILEQVNRLSFIDPDGVVQSFSRKPDEEFDPEAGAKRSLLIAELDRKPKIEFEDIKKLLGLPRDVVFNLERGGMKSLVGNRTDTEYVKIFGKGWSARPMAEREKIHQTVMQARDTEWLAAHAQGKWGLDEEKAEKLASKIHFEDKYMHLSKKAINKLVPFLEDGLSVSDAMESAGYTAGENIGNFRARMANLRNPIVKQTLYELLRLLKVIKLKYGGPALVRVELARELKLSAKRREEVHFENLRRRKENEEIGRRLAEMGVKPTHDARLRYKLWKECKEICPYTGATISCEALFSENRSFDIEHIIPWPRSLDDSFMNKTLCRVDENGRKGNNTPYEFYHGTRQHEEILQRVKTFPYPKRKRFMQKEVSDDFVARQLNDTAYISREARSLLESMGFKVQVGKGQATAELRHLWGLNSLLGGGDVKSRDDHRHHAVDAAAVAMTDPGVLHRLSAYNKYGRDSSNRIFPPPWEGFRDSLKSRVDKILISHRVNKRASGPLHEKTLYGVTGMTDEGNGAPLFVTRKPLDKLEHPMVEKIVDKAIKGIVKARLRELGVNPDAKKFDIPKNAFKDLCMISRKGEKIPIKKVRIHTTSNNMVLLPKRNKTGVEPGGNHHVVLFEYLDKKGNRKQGGEICTLFEAVRRADRGEPVIRRDVFGEGRKFLFSLAINETVLLDMGESQVDWNGPDYEELSKKLHRVQKLSLKSNREYIFLRPHRDSTLEQEPISKTAGSFKGIKVRIDPIGRIFKAHD
ncbi:type II CRISPR RNA-guided endonuclease Cas9 [bacterium]|nr:type II CRISPR RNA-guided endonuclease Cas9 [bacterium]